MAEMEVHCVICTEQVPQDRVAQGAITCTKEHAKERENRLRTWKDSRECRYCGKPSTLEQRSAYRRFRRIERRRPDLLYPAEYATWIAELESRAGVTDMPARPIEEFAKWWKDKPASESGASDE